MLALEPRAPCMAEITLDSPISYIDDQIRCRFKGDIVQDQNFHLESLRVYKKEYYNIGDLLMNNE